MFANPSVQAQQNLFRILALALCVFALVGMVMINSTTVAFCADPDSEPDVGETIETAVSGLTEKIYNIIRSVIIPLCIVALAFAAFQFLAGGSKGAENARKAVIGVIAAVAFVVFSPLVMYTVGDMLSGSGSGTWDEYNPLDG